MTMFSSEYKLDLCPGLSNDTSSDNTLRMYAIIPLPPVPPEWAWNGSDIYHTPLTVNREILVEETDSTLTETVHCQQSKAIYEVDTTGAITTPTWRTDEGSDAGHPGTTEFVASEEHRDCRFMLMRIGYDFTADASTDEISAYNLWVEASHDEAYAGDDAQYLDRVVATESDRLYGPDKALSAFLVQDVLIHSLNQVLYENVPMIDVPVFGIHANPA